MLSPAPLESLQQPPNSLASKTPLTHTEVFPLNYSCRSAKLDENLQRREAAPCKPSSPTAVAVPAPAESPARARRDSLRPTPDLLLSARGAWSQSGSLISESAGTPSRVEGARPSSSGSLGYGRGDKTAPRSQPSSVLAGEPGNTQGLRALWLGLRASSWGKNTLQRKGPKRNPHNSIDLCAKEMHLTFFPLLIKIFL